MSEIQPSSTHFRHPKTEATSEKKLSHWQICIPKYVHNKSRKRQLSGYFYTLNDYMANIDLLNSIL
jgi:hypothetical protein